MLPLPLAATSLGTAALQPPGDITPASRMAGPFLFWCIIAASPLGAQLCSPGAGNLTLISMGWVDRTWRVVNWCRFYFIPRSFPPPPFKKWGKRGGQRVQNPTRVPRIVLAAAESCLPSQRFLGDLCLLLKPFLRAVYLTATLSPPVSCFLPAPAIPAGVLIDLHEFQVCAQEAYRILRQIRGNKLFCFELEIRYCFQTPLRVKSRCC